jgi:plastocyanin
MAKQTYLSWGFAAFAILGMTALGCHRQPSGFTPPGAGHPAAVVVVSDHPAEFVPNVLTVHVGDTVQWYNTGGISHSVEFLNADGDGNSFIMKPQQGASYTFTQPGTYRYGCRFHIIDGMEGKIIVEADPNLTKVSDDKR